MNYKAHDSTMEEIKLYSTVNNLNVILKNFITKQDFYLIFWIIHWFLLSYI